MHLGNEEIPHGVLEILAAIVFVLTIKESERVLLKCSEYYRWCRIGMLLLNDVCQSYR